MTRHGNRLCIFLLASALSGIGVAASPVHAATFTIVNNDSPGEGFNDPTPATPVGGNTGTTLGAQRLIAFQRAAEIWGPRLSSSVTIRVRAQFDPLACNATSAVLGSAGPITAFRDCSGAPVANTWYPVALANALNGSDLDPSGDDISATFNSTIGTTCAFPRGWYYGLDASPPGDQIDFVSVLLHELGHGLGFLTFVDLATGAKLSGLNDAYMRNLESHGASPPDYPSMSNAQRVAASTATGNLHWVGANVRAASGALTAGTVGDHVRMFAPNPQQPGSSVSHWDTVLTPNQVMEPSYTVPLQNPVLELPLFQDIGWTLLTGPSALQVAPATNIAASGSPSGPFTPGSFQYQLSASSGSVDFSIAGMPSWLTASFTSGTVTTTPITVTFSVNASANSLAPGTYGPAVISFTNTTNGQGNTTRTATLTVTAVTPAPANDNFANAIAIQANQTLTGTNVGATKQAGEPNHAANSGGKSVWWTYTAPSSGLVLMNTVGSNFDTLLAVYTGSAVNALTQVAANDNGIGGITSSVAFNATAGTTYRIAVDGFNPGNPGTAAASGNITLNVTQSVPPTLVVTPATDISSDGAVGGPFVADQFQYELSSSSGTVNYAITGVPSWLTASSLSGTVGTSATAVTFTVNANTLSPGSYSATISFTNTSNGQGNATRSATLNVTPPAGACDVASRLGDFNGDVRSDMLIRRGDGTLALFLMNGFSVQAAEVIGQVGAEWILSGVGDFNGDGRSDMLFRRADGATSIFLMNGFQILNAQVIGQIGPEWRLVGVGDFNGDGRNDMLFRRADGTLALFLMNGFSVQAAQVIGQVGAEWTLSGVGDFNGDGRSDMLFRRADGTMSIFLMNGFQILDAQVIGQIGIEWRVVGVADFNGDGRGDMLLRRNDGMLALFLMNGFTVAAADLLGQVGGEWTLTGVGDFNGDSRSDMLFRRADGATSIFLLNGLQILDAQVIGQIGVEWNFCQGQPGAVSVAGASPQLTRLGATSRR